MTGSHTGSAAIWTFRRRRALVIALCLWATALEAQQPAPRTAPRTSIRRTRARRPPAPPPLRWMAVSAGANHSCALDLTGQAWCWGDNAWRRLGISDSVNMRRPTRVETPQRFRLVSAGTTETCAVTERGGGIVCWGGSFPGTMPRTVLADREYTFLALHSNACAISSDGNGWCWGTNGSGQLGSGSPSTEVAPTPQPLAGGQKWRVVEPSAGSFACGLNDASVAHCWGSNANGQLGAGPGEGSRVPEAVTGASVYQSITVGTEHACGLGMDGTAWCWGKGEDGALGDGRRSSSAVPVRVAGDQHWTQLAAGFRFTCGLDDAGKAWCWGNGQYGVLGTGNTRASDIPIAVRGTLRFTMLSAGQTHVCGVAAGQLYCWGDNADGQLGLARAQTCRTPIAPRQVDVRQCAMAPTRVQTPN